MRLDPAACRRQVANARFAVLATRSPSGAADLVPITFALHFADAGDRLFTAVDHKAKTTQRLARLANIAQTPTVDVLIDHRDDADWSSLWWVRARGTARERPPGTARHLLMARYAQYRERPPQGPVIEVLITEWQGWSAQP